METNLLQPVAPAPEVHVGITDQSEPELPLAAEGVLRYIWHSRFGDMLLEVRDGQTFVNGKRVEPAAAIHDTGSGSDEMAGPKV